MNKIVSLLNRLLPAGKMLADNASESDMNEAAAIIEQHHTTRAMLAAESKSTHTTRPRIAYGAFMVLAFATVLSVSIWAAGVLSGNVDMVKTVVEGWPFLVGVLGPLVTLLLAYFGVLRGEQSDRLNAATGVTRPVGAIKTIIESVIGKA